MKITVCGMDRTGDLGARIDSSVNASCASVPALDLRDLLQLRDASFPAAFTEKYIAIARGRCGVRTDNFKPPRKPGIRGAIGSIVRMALWKLLKHQHDRMAFQDSAIHSQLLAVAEFQREDFLREIRRLNEKIEALENGRESL